MTTALDYTDTQRYLQHFRHQGCHAEIIDNTEGLFNLCWLNITLIDQLRLELEKKKVNIVRLREMISGMNGHSHASTDDDSDTKNDNEEGCEKTPAEFSPPENNKSTAKGTDEKPKGHGRRGANDYPGAKTVVCHHEKYKAGDTCPLCQRGLLLQAISTTRIQIDGTLPLMGTRYEIENIACTLCPFTTAANPPVDLSKKYTEKAKAVLAYLHYGMGLPYYRLARMQAMLGIPIAVSTQSDLIASMLGSIHCMFNYLVISAAQSELLYQDDTGVKIQALIKENKDGNPARKGMFTSGFIAKGEHTIVLYFSGRAHAGENFDSIIAHREINKGTIHRMADAISANSKHEADVIALKCNGHAFRRFRSLLSTYPEAALFVLGIYGKVYDNDETCKMQKMDDQARLAHHQLHSEPLMKTLETWFNRVLSAGEVEPNSVLAAECQYLSNHWEGLTQFLRIAGAPLDNNALEAMLKYMITYRKNSQSFKTVYSADYGSRLISIIVTCMVNNIDAIDYLTQLQLHEHAVWQNPEAWAPWQYQKTLQQIDVPQAQAA